MILSNISILNYKNISSAQLDLSPKVNCLIGHNGAGKTNFLDAVYYLSFCKSAFNPSDTQLVTHGSEFFVLDGKYADEKGDETDVFAGVKKGSKKRFKKDGKDYTRLSQHIGLIPLIMISPADTVLIEGGSEHRRRLMDIVISQYDPEYIESLSRYNKALQQRNALLKSEEEPDASLMNILEEQMAWEGEKVYSSRADFVEKLSPVFQEIYDEISGKGERVSLSYTSHCQRGNLLDVIRKDRFKDRAVGYSLHGVHRDDLEMLIDDYSMKVEGSQGQHKTFVLALKLSQFNFLRHTSSSTCPILLLDDIFDKLDARRVEQIVKIVSGDGYGQIFVTDTNRDHLDKILEGTSYDYKLFGVADGEITEMEHGNV